MRAVGCIESGVLRVVGCVESGVVGSNCCLQILGVRFVYKLKSERYPLDSLTDPTDIMLHVLSLAKAPKFKKKIV